METLKTHLEKRVIEIVENFEEENDVKCTSKENMVALKFRDTQGNCTSLSIDELIDLTSE